MFPRVHTVGAYQRGGDGQKLARIRFKGFRTPPDYGYYYIMSFSFCKRYITKYSPKFLRAFLLYCTTFVHFLALTTIRVYPPIAPHAENRHAKRQSLGNRCGKPYARHAKQRRHEDNTARQEEQRAQERQERRDASITEGSEQC